MSSKYGKSHVDELAFIADLKHGLALLPSTLEETKDRVARIRRKLDKEEQDLIMPVSLGVEVDEMEVTYMLETCLLPRRVVMRLRN